MLGKTFQLFNLLGFPIRIDLSWFVVAILVTWSLARGVFPQAVAGLSATSYWTMGVFGAIGLFASIVLHELGHAVVARRFAMPIREIVLFIFGGVARLEKEPPHARAEFFVAIGGPVVSAALGVGFLLVGAVPTWQAQTGTVLRYVGTINLIVLAFNLVPAFPLDGGRMLRAALWSYRNDLRWATRITSAIGSGFGALLVVLGMFAFISGNVVGGVWWALIGLFLRSAAGMSYRQLVVRGALEGEPIRRFMNATPSVVSPHLSLREVVDEYVYERHHKMFPLVKDGRLVGCVTTRDIKAVPRERWESTTAAEAAQPCSERNTIGVDSEATDALTRMQRENVSRLMVTDGDRLVGVVALKDLMAYLTLKLELES